VGTLETGLVDGGDFLFLVGIAVEVGCLVGIGGFFGFSLCFGVGFLELVVFFI
jgi:hypothetical protein